MSVNFDGHGITYTRSGLTAKVKTVKLGGYSKEEIDVTTHSNTAVKTKVLTTLKNYGDISLTLECDPSVYGGTISAGNASTVITFPNSAGSITFWADVKQVGEVTYEQGSSNQVTFELTLTVTNRNGSGVETAPVYSA
jgi:hypothetical protein